MPAISTKNKVKIQTTKRYKKLKMQKRVKSTKTAPKRQLLIKYKIKRAKNTKMQKEQKKSKTQNGNNIPKRAKNQYW